MKPSSLALSSSLLCCCRSSRSWRAASVPASVPASDDDGNEHSNVSLILDYLLKVNDFFSYLYSISTYNLAYHQHRCYPQQCLTHILIKYLFIQERDSSRSR